MLTETSNTNDLWLAQKLGKFSSSEMFKLLVEGKTKDKPFGDAAINYINEKVSEIITGEIAFSFTSGDMQWGKDNEQDAAITYQQQYGADVKLFGGTNPIFVEYGTSAGGSPDAYIDEDGLGEIKCPNSATHVTYMRMQNAADLLKCEKKYYVQIQSNLLFCKKEWAHFISYDPRVINHKHRLKVIEVPRDEPMIETIKTRIDLATQELKNILKQIGY